LLNCNIMLNNNKISDIYILTNPVIYKFRSRPFVAKRYVLHLKRNCKIILPFRSWTFVAKRYLLHFNRKAKKNKKNSVLFACSLFSSLWSIRVILSESTGWLWCSILFFGVKHNMAIPIKQECQLWMSLHGLSL
jgi:hypothetical protein